MKTTLYSGKGIITHRFPNKEPDSARVCGHLLFIRVHICLFLLESFSVVVIFLSTMSFYMRWPSCVPLVHSSKKHDSNSITLKCLDHSTTGVTFKFEFFYLMRWCASLNAAERTLKGITHWLTKCCGPYNHKAFDCVRNF